MPAQQPSRVCGSCGTREIPEAQGFCTSFPLRKDELRPLSLMDPKYEIREYLRTIREAWPQEKADRMGLAYRGPADFVLREGRWWKPLPRPEGMRRGAPRTCYGSSLAGAILYPGHRYVEGYAVSPVDATLICPHAWLADADDNVVDLVWNPVGMAYLGVEFSLERADDASWDGDASVIDDYNRGWPVLRERWRGELDEPDPSWMPSPPMLAARAFAAGDFAEAYRQSQLGWEVAEAGTCPDCGGQQEVCSCDWIERSEDS